jgi:hypothetical protein
VDSHTKSHKETPPKLHHENPKKRLRKSPKRENGRDNKSLDEPRRITYTYMKVHTRFSLPPNHHTLSQDLTMKLSS